MIGTDAYDRIVALLNARQIAYQMHSHAPMRTADEIRLHGRFPLDECLKCVPFRVKRDDDPWLLVALLAEDTVDYKKLATTLNVRREHLMRPTPEEMHATFGYEPGAVSAIPSIEGVRVFIDQRATQVPKVYCGTGIVGTTLEITMVDVIRASNAEIADISKQL